jgi:hypothetical protein
MCARQSSRQVRHVVLNTLGTPSHARQMFEAAGVRGGGGARVLVLMPGWSTRSDVGVDVRRALELGLVVAGRSAAQTTSSCLRAGYLALRVGADPDGPSPLALMRRTAVCAGVAGRPTGVGAAQDVLDFHVVRRVRSVSVPAEVLVEPPRGCCVESRRHRSTGSPVMRDTAQSTAARARPRPQWSGCTARCRSRWASKQTKQANPGPASTTSTVFDGSLTSACRWAATASVGTGCRRRGGRSRRRWRWAPARSALRRRRSSPAGTRERTNGRPGVMGISVPGR